VVGFVILWLLDDQQLEAKVAVSHTKACLCQLSFQTSLAAIEQVFFEFAA